MLVNEAASYGYPIYDGVVQLVRDEAIVLDDQISNLVRNKSIGGFNKSE